MSVKPYTTLFLATLALSAQADGTCFNFETLGPDGQPQGWTRFNIGAAMVDWSSSSDPACDGGATDNLTGEIGEFGCLYTPDSSANVGVDAYLCSPPIDISDPQSRDVEFNLFIGSPTSSEEHNLEVLFGTEQPSASSVQGYQVVYSRAGTTEVGAASPTLANLTIDEPFAKAGFLCFRFQSETDGYIGIDNVQTAPPSCTPFDFDTDRDNISDGDDNCIAAINGLQQDTNGDGFGNSCDPDLNNDCAVNATDLGILKSNFFMNGPNDADFDGNFIVGFVDLGIMRAFFFSPPGPSGTASCASN